MTYLSNKIALNKEPKFPGSGARLTTSNANGFEIDYYDTLNQPQSMFIWGSSWGVARRDFERRISFTQIAGHRSAQMNY